MSESSSNLTESSEQPSSNDETKTDSSPDKRKLSLSQSENTFDNQKSIKPNLLGRVKSWSSKDQHPKDKCTSIELDLARSLSKLEVTASQNDIGSNLVRARDSLEQFQNDEQNMPKPNLEKSVLRPKPKSIPGSPKSSPQLGEKWRASPSKLSFWNPYDRQSKKNRKDLKKKGKGKNLEPLEDKCSPSAAETKKLSIMKKGNDDKINETANHIALAEASIVEDEGNYTFKYLPKNSKSVVFTNEVLVVYFNNEDVVGEEKEPLKKEIEQQARNKEMRRIHLNKTQERYNLCLF